MDALLLFPPATDPRSPHLAIPSLAAALRSDGLDVGVRDLDLEGLLFVLRRDLLTTALRECERLAARSPGSTRLRDVITRGELAIDTIDGALTDLRRDAFYDPDRHHAARASIRAALALSSAASVAVTYDSARPCYSVNGVDPSRLADLVRVSADDGANLFGPLYDEVADEVDRTGPTVVGISILNHQQIVPGLMLARKLKQRAHFVVIGGTVYAKFVERLRQRPLFFETFCDALVPYEGETALRALVDAVGGSDPLDDVPNVLYRDARGDVRATRIAVEDVRSFPTPDFTGLPLDEYLAPEPVFPILNGKGCYFNRCKFCDIPFINNIAARPYRERGAEQVATDIANLQFRFGARNFEFTDETLHPHHFLDVGKALSDRGGVDARFVGYARLEPGFTPERCEQLYEMGVRKLFFGLESGAQETLDHMDKGIKVSTAHRVLRNCSAAGIAFHVFSIVGFPEETDDRARQTLGFFIDAAESIAPPGNTFDIHPFGLDLRTEYFDDADRFGIRFDTVDLASRDFPIGIERWHNSRGLGADDVERLLEEFHAVLQGHFRESRHYPDQQFPGYEEYALLYSRRYENTPFDFRLGLPPPGDETPIRLVWSATVRVESGEQHLRRVVGCDGSIELSDAALALLGMLPVALPVDSLLETVAGEIEHAPEAHAELLVELRLLIDRLAAKRLLHIRPDHCSARREAWRTRRTARLVLRPDVTPRVGITDRTVFGSPLSGRPRESTRAILPMVVEQGPERWNGHISPEDTSLLEAAVRADAFGAVTERRGTSGWTLAPAVLYPEPDAARPTSLAFIGGGSIVRANLSPTHWPHAHELVAQLVGAGIDRRRRPAHPDVAALLDTLIARGLVIETEREDEPVQSDLTFVGHNTVVVRSSTTRVVVDPFLFRHAARHPVGYQPLLAHELGAIDAVVITHSHPDHFDPASLLQFAAETPVIVPAIERETVLSVAMADRLRRLGFRNVRELGWGAATRVGDVEVHALPFYGEQPSSGPTLHPEVRNEGNTYVIRTATFSAAFLADSGRDDSGDMRHVAREWRTGHGPVDVVFSGYRGWFLYPPRVLFTSVAAYLLFVPPSSWGTRDQLMSDADDALDIAGQFGARTLVPCASGGAPWYWERGLGPRLDGVADEDPVFDPFPERVLAAERHRAAKSDGTGGASPEVRLLRPGESLVDPVGAPRVVRPDRPGFPYSPVRPDRFSSEIDG